MKRAPMGAPEACEQFDPSGRDLFTRRTLLALTGGFLLAGCGARRDTPAAPHVLTRARADQVVVYKGTRQMHLVREGVAFRTYRVALGFAPQGHKIRDSDGRTPEGRYWIDRRNPRSAFHLSLGISYPNEADALRAQAMGWRPGGNIFIHGEPNGQRASSQKDWTAGCIAVTNDEMEEVWATVPTGIPITIHA